MTDVKSALVVRGGWYGHQPIEATDLFIPHLEKTASRYGSRSPRRSMRTPLLAGVDLIVQCMTCPPSSRDEFEGLRAAVEAGTGLAGWHGGIADSYRNTSDYLHLIGGQFACHPGKHPAERIGEQSDNYVPLHGEHAAGRRPSTRSRPGSATSTWSPSSTGCSPTTTSTCSPPRPRRYASGTRGTGRSPRRPSGPGSGARADLRGHARASRRHPRRAERQHDHQAGTAVGQPMMPGPPEVPLRRRP